jgi:hypothetical protein
VDFEVMDKISGIAVFAFAIVGVFALALGLGLLFAFPVMWLTNYLFAPALLLKVFGVARLTFWKAYWFSVFMSWMVKSSPTSAKSSK